MNNHKVNDFSRYLRFFVDACKPGHISEIDPILTFVIARLFQRLCMNAKQLQCLSIDCKQDAVGAKKSAILTIEHAHQGQIRNWTDSSTFLDDRRIKECAGRKQSLLPLPDFSRKIEGDSARRVLRR